MASNTPRAAPLDRNTMATIASALVSSPEFEETLQRIMHQQAQPQLSTVPFTNVEDERSSLFSGRRSSPSFLPSSSRSVASTTTATSLRGCGNGSNTVRRMYGGTSFAPNRARSAIPTRNRRTTTSTATKPPFIVKEIILLDTFNNSCTIRGAKKAELFERGKKILSVDKTK